MKINIQKILFHTLTNQNGEVSYYGEVYLKKCGNWVSRKPVSFALNLIKIRFHYGILKSTSPLKLKGIKDRNIHLNYFRLKLSQSMRVMLDYRNIITDLWGSLLQPSLSEDAVFQILENEFGIKGFANVRKKYQDTKVSIEKIYEKINKEFQSNLSPDLEIKLVSDTVLVNSFVLENIDTAVANQTVVTAVVDSCYPMSMFEEILERNRISCISEIVITSERQKSVQKLVSEYVKKYKKQEKGYDKSVRIYAADYDKYILKQRRKGNTASYYPLPYFFLKKNNIPGFKSPFGELYRRVEGLLNYSRPFSRSDEYQTAVLYLAPSVFGFLQEAEERSEGREVVFIGSGNHILVKIFQKYWKNASVIEWSYIAANQPEKSDEWQIIFNKMPFLEKISADRIAEGLGFSAPSYKLERVRGEFIKKWSQSKYDGFGGYDGVQIYLQSMLCNKKSVLFVDLTENSMGGKSLLDKIEQYNIVLDYNYFSLNTYFCENKIEKEIGEKAEGLFHRIMQIELPVLLKISMDRISFAQPPMFPPGEKERIYSGMEEYVRIMSDMVKKNNRVPKISAREIVELLLAGETSIQRVSRRFIE